MARTVIAGAIALASLAAFGCERTPDAPLLELSEVTPKRVELGDKLEIEGASLPEGRDARVVLRGVLVRPGESPEAAEVETVGRVATRDRILVPVTPELLGAICGADASHTTFTGSVEVAFAAKSSGAPPVTGTIEKATIDVVPQGTSRNDEAGARTLAAMGAHLGDTSEGGDARMGLQLAAVDPGSAAERAGLAAGDRVMAFGGVRVVSAADAVLAPGSRAVTLTVTHAARTTEEDVVVDVGDLAPPARTRVSLGFAFALLAAVAIVGRAGPLARWAAWLESRLGAKRTTRGSHAGALVFAAAVSLAALPLARPWFGARLDLGLVLVAVVIASSSLAASYELGLAAKLRSWGRSLVRTLPAAFALVAVALRAGSLSSDDVLRAQGAYPWQSLAAKSPVGILLAAMLMAPFALRGRRDSASGEVTLAFASAWTTTLVLGAWRAPGEAATHVTALGVMLFAAKSALVFFVARGVRSALPAVGAWAWATRVLPASALVLALDLACGKLGVTPAAGLVAGSLGVASVCWFALRALRGAERPRVDAMS